MSKQTEENISDMLAKLDELMAWFNQDELDIEAALKKFEAATALTEQIKQRLAEVDNKITVLRQRFDVPEN